MINRRPSKEEGGGYSWMDTYGDMVTLLLTFFVLLFAFSSVDADKWNSLVQAFTGSPPLQSIAAVDMLTLPDFSKDLPSSSLNLDGMALGSNDQKEMDAASQAQQQALTPEQLAQMAVPVSAQQRMVMESDEYLQNEAEFSLLYERLVLYIQTNGLEDMLFASRDMESIYLRVAAGVLFDSGKADLVEEAMPVLDTLEEIFYNAGAALSLMSVEGHTDNVPISNARFKDNWELSSMRAINVVRYMLDKGRLTPDMFAFTGYGEYKPIAGNDTEAGKQQNRRVEFVLRKRVITTADLTAQGEPSQAEKDIAVNELPNELQEVPIENGRNAAQAQDIGKRTQP
ncbi:MAG: flagellar motor protein MotB [Candidatus Pelethousia sp.]|nr:flagellar motor protein MotB [Candidatus Pelethousia sp.]